MRVRNLRAYDESSLLLVLSSWVWDAWDGTQTAACQLSPYRMYLVCDKNIEKEEVEVEEEEV